MKYMYAKINKSIREKERQTETERMQKRKKERDEQTNKQRTNERRNVSKLTQEKITYNHCTKGRKGRGIQHTLMSLKPHKPHVGSCS